MTYRELVRPMPGATPTGSSSGGTREQPIPPDLLREASQRLGIMALLACALWLLATALWHFSVALLNPTEPWRGFGVPDTIALMASTSSLALYFYIRRGNRPPEFYLKLGLGYMVLNAYGLGNVLHTGDPMSETIPTITWVGVIVLMFAAIAPNRPRTMFIASLIAVSMNPLAMVALQTQHPSFPATGLTAADVFGMGVLMHYPDFLLAGVAAVISGVVTRLGRQVSKAREMGSYQLGDLIKRGGMGEVYKATHRMLARPAAIKLIRPEMLGAEDGESADIAVKRFHREAEAAANLRSPHTVELFDFGITEDKTLYFVMELLEGLDLETMVREHGPLPPRRVAHIIGQACESLEEAHALGLIHRDIKPANIHVGKVGARYDFVKVLDFGLVKSVSKEDSQVSLATAVGRTPGTPSYMAPEMALGEGVDARADIYALGCVAYFLLTGKLVFDAETTFQMIAKHMRNEPVPPSLRAGIDIPPAMEKLVLACLAKSPDHRPSSARALRESIESLRQEPWSENEAAAWWSSRYPASPGSAGKSPPAEPAGSVAPDPGSRFAEA